MKIQDLMQEFAGNYGYRCEGQKASSVWASDLGDKLFSYGTVLCQKVHLRDNKTHIFLGEALIINVTKYSVTTSRQQTWLKKAAKKYPGRKVYFVDNVPIWAKDLEAYCSEL